MKARHGADPWLQLQQSIGNRAVSQLLESQAGTASSGAGGAGLPEDLKAGLEGLSGMDLSDVRVHYNSDKPARIHALAYTQGSEIHIAPGQERHLPHEGWHAVQQKQGRVRATTQAMGRPVNDSGALEREADGMGERAARHSAAPSTEGIRPEPAANGPAGSAEAPIQGVFQLNRRYRPYTSGIKAKMWEEDSRSVTRIGGQELMEDLDKMVYLVKEIIPKEDVSLLNMQPHVSSYAILHEEQSGASFIIASDQDDLFVLVEGDGEGEGQIGPAQQNGFIGLPIATASSWEKQKTKTGCWFAATAALCGRTQDELMNRLGWGKDSLYTILTTEMVSLGQLIGVNLVEVKKEDLTPLYIRQKLEGGKPLIISIPNHMEVLFFITQDNQRVGIWDPSDESIRTQTYEETMLQCRTAFHLG
ncbi:DUF4157 domain-containing protein [Cohnella hongkongensis]|uniref:DUF4157 domain-containing protein n=1 Tax=Cohnella hongkongensis TaxID=178337 RepID=A0ABV9FEW2_9BACL